jgi:23S rRNA G2445 N2-methylase RlmL
MPRFLAITSRGLLEPLTAELEELKIKRVRARPDCVEFDSSWADCYRVHVHSRLATRVLLPVADFQAYNQDDLYFGVLRKHDFTQYIFPNQTLRVEAHVREHKTLHDQRFVAMKTKDAIVDQFWKKFNERPSVGEEDNTDLRVVIRVVGTQVSMALDLTGETLSNRGYRRFAGEAPLREHVAAGLLRLAKWEQPNPLVDPFCGAGTVLIEAALRCSGASGLKRRRQFTFERLRNFQEQIWTEIKNEDPKRRAPPAKPFLFGYDIDPAILEKARANARTAGVENWILFQQRDVRQLTPPGEYAGWIITNPPYGDRLSDKESAKKLMADFSKTLKTSFKNWQAWILSGDAEVMSGLKFKAKRRIPVWNGPIECRFLNYPVT